MAKNSGKGSPYKGSPKNRNRDGDYKSRAEESEVDTGYKVHYRSPSKDGKGGYKSSAKSGGDGGYKSSAKSGGKDGSYKSSKNGGKDGSYKSSKNGGKDGSYKSSAKGGGKDGSYKSSKNGGKDGGYKSSKSGGKDGTYKSYAKGGKSGGGKSQAKNAVRDTERGAVAKNSADEVSLKALAKINLGLDVIGEREDGYHDVKMIMQSIHLYDRVDIRRTKSPHIYVDVDLFYISMDEENLAYKAAKLMKDEYGIRDGVHVTLQKYIPVAAGLGGGSADAAAVMVGMNRLFHLGIKNEDLAQLGLKIGADVPFCIMRGTALAEGIGEKLTPLPPMPHCQILIAKPGVAVSTKHVYDQLKLTPYTQHPDIDGMVDAIKEKDLTLLGERMGNILESVTVAECPVIREIKSLMKEHGAVGAMMSGSGPSVFGIYRNDVEIHEAYDAIKASGLAKSVYATEIYTNHR